MKYLKDLLKFFIGKKEYSFYFQSITIGDSLLIFFLLLCQIFRLNLFKKRSNKFINELKRKFKFQKAFFIW